MDCTSDASSDSGMIQLDGEEPDDDVHQLLTVDRAGSHGGHGVEGVPEAQDELGPQGRQVVQEVAHDETRLRTRRGGGRGGTG